MSAKGTSMQKLTQIIRLHFDAKLSTRPIAKSLGLSVGVVNKYINRARANNLSWPLPNGMDERALNELLKAGSGQPKQSLAATSIDFIKVHQELSRKVLGLANRITCAHDILRMNPR
jgi:response regulator of citrate/malate metabolism